MARGEPSPEAVRRSNEKRRARRLADPEFAEKLRAASRAYYYANREKMLAQQRARLANPEKRAQKAATSADWAKANREKINAAERVRYHEAQKKHRETCRKRQKKHWQKLMADPIRAEAQRQKQREYRKALKAGHHPKPKKLTKKERQKVVVEAKIVAAGLYSKVEHEAST